jgi:hypothetical protein
VRPRTSTSRWPPRRRSPEQRRDFIGDRRGQRGDLRPGRRGRRDPALRAHGRGGVRRAASIVIGLILGAVALVNDRIRAIVQDTPSVTAPETEHRRVTG